MQMDKKLVEEMIRMAKNQMKYSYAPYSGFKVGAVLLTDDGEFYTGCNIENAAYTPTICAERNAIFKAVSEGHRKFSAICIAGGKDGVVAGYTAPCGVCRQVMMEFCSPKEFNIILTAGDGSYKIYTLKELLPLGFGPDDLR